MLKYPIKRIILKKGLFYLRHCSPTSSRQYIKEMVHSIQNMSHLPAPVSREYPYVTMLTVSWFSPPFFFTFDFFLFSLYLLLLLLFIIVFSFFLFLFFFISLILRCCPYSLSSQITICFRKIKKNIFFSPSV